MRIKGSTPDAEIAANLTPEEILTRFDNQKAIANVADTERDRLRKYIQDNMPNGRYGKWQLVKTAGTDVTYANSAGLYKLKSALIIDAGPFFVPLAPGQVVRVVDESGELLVTGVIVDNSTLYTEKPPIKLGLTEVHDGATD